MHLKLQILILLLTINLLVNLTIGKTIETINDADPPNENKLTNGRNGDFSDLLSGLGSGLLANEGVGLLATLWIKLIVAAFIIWIWWGGYYGVDSSRRHSSSLNSRINQSNYERNIDLDSIVNQPNFKLAPLNQPEISYKEGLVKSKPTSINKNFMKYFINSLAKFVFESIDQS